MRTDLAKEARGKLPDCVGVTEEVAYEEGIDVSRILVHTDEAQRLLDKPKGRYVTITFSTPALSDRDARGRIARRTARELIAMQRIDADTSVLVIGLGNRHVTPDSLGPLVAEHIFVTRHIQLYCDDILSEKTRTVTAFSTGVLGVTGMETAEVVRGLVSTVRPDLVLIVDALASMEAGHIGNVIQMNDSGISPGAGIGNFRRSLNRESLGVPVVTLGMPLVVSSGTIVVDALSKISPKRDWNGVVKLVERTLPKEFISMIVSPKDIDAMVSDAAKLISDAINLTLHGEQYSKLEKLLR
ncbi:MAG: GPR endopeptidase [Clostridia bacterium]|nr:GPR endopeptidase [Clostridia bacterium]